MRRIGLIAFLLACAALPAFAQTHNAPRGQTNLNEADGVGVSTTSAAASGAAASASPRGIVTSEALVTAAGSDYVLTLTNPLINTNSLIDVAVANGTNTTEGLGVLRVQPGTGSAVIHIRNFGSGALNGTIKIFFWVQN